MTVRQVIVTPDAQYPDDGELEFAEGPEFDWRIFHESDVSALPADDLAAAQALVTWHVMKIDAEFINRMPNCRVVIRAGVGFDHIDIEAAGRRGIPVCNTPDYGISEVADHAIGLMLALRRGIVVFDRRLRTDPSANFGLPAPPLLQRNRGTTFGVVGLGPIGLATALRAKALGMRVLVYDPYAATGLEITMGFTRTDDFEELLEESDTISIHCPLTDETRGLFDAAAFQRMKSSAILINTARGPVVDAAALVQALEGGEIGGAALDVFAAEPIPSESPIAKLLARDPQLLDEGRLILTPHASWMSPESSADVRRLSARAAIRFLRGGTPRNIVNRKYLTVPAGGDAVLTAVV